MMNSFSAYHITLAPLISYQIIGALAATVLLFLLISAFAYRRGMFVRPLIAIFLLGMLLNPVLIEQERVPIKDVAVIVVDKSSSQSIGQRTARTERARLELQKTIEAQTSLELRTIEAPLTTDDNINETHLFSALDSILADVPESRRAGVIFLTDGQIHDVPQDTPRLTEYGPIHVLLSGNRNENDRRLVITNAPAYSLVGQSSDIKFKVETTSLSGATGQTADVIIRENDQPAQHIRVPVGEEQTVSVNIDRAGQNIIELETAPTEDELTIVNNRMPVVINGVRDRLKVLLVSGQPHAGGRTWRNTLTSDPGVDLVHFTILREPDKVDFTPQNELSLIAFPFRELFEVKLYDFDLIIFDRYRLNRILPMHYFENIAKYVREGGALLEVNGPSYASQNSIFTTALKDILPAYPVGDVITQKFTPALTAIGKAHPVTLPLEKLAQSSDQPWGPWFRQVNVQAEKGNVLMNGANGTPLLTLDRVDQGRVAQLSSDEIWLWARGYDGGGPQAELLRRLIHWLMKEPELEENALDTNVNNKTIEITRHTISDKSVTVRVETPDGHNKTVILSPQEDGSLHGQFKATGPGVYKLSDDLQSRFVIVGDPSPPELMDVHSTAKPMRKAVNVTHGSVKWLEDNPSLNIRLLAPDRHYNLQNSIALRSNNSFEIKGTKQQPLLPPWAALALMLAVILGGWAYEGRREKPVKGPSAASQN